MNILAIETATPVCAIGLRSNEREVVRILDHDRRHTEVLAAGVAALLEDFALRARDLDRVVVDVGPGLFTGLRVGIASAIGLCEGVGCASVEVTSLELLAHAAHERGTRGTLLAAVDGRRGEIFVQRFALADTLQALDTPVVRTARDVVIECATNGAPVSFTGDGVQRYLKDFSAVPNGVVIDDTVPSLHAALALGEVRSPSPVITPLYLREADAVANFSTRSRPQ